MPIAHHIVWDGRWYAVINNSADGPCSTCSCTNATVCPSRPSHHPHHLAPLDACPHARSQAGGALQSSCPCCRRSFFPHPKGLVLYGAVLLYTAAQGLPRVAKIELLRVLRGGRSASHAACRAPGTRWGRACGPLVLCVACWFAAGRSLEVAPVSLRRPIWPLRRACVRKFELCAMVSE